MLSHKISISDEILDILFKPSNRDKFIPMGSMVVYKHKRQSVYNTFYQLKEQGYISKEGNNILLLPKGRRYVENKKARLMTFDSPFKKGAPRDLLVMFDIPEKKKAEREWFRFQLRKFDYQMIQKSVWVGPSPLPKEFLDYVKSLKLKDCIKTFKLEKSYHTHF